MLNALIVRPRPHTRRADIAPSEHCGFTALYRLAVVESKKLKGAQVEPHLGNPIPEQGRCFLGLCLALMGVVQRATGVMGVSSSSSSSESEGGGASTTHCLRVANNELEKARGAGHLGGLQY